MTDPSPPPVRPWDAHNQKLVSNVHPADWKNATLARLAAVSALPLGRDEHHRTPKKPTFQGPRTAKHERIGSSRGAISRAASLSLERR